MALERALGAIVCAKLLSADRVRLVRRGRPMPNGEPVLISEHLPGKKKRRWRQVHAAWISLRHHVPSVRALAAV